MVAAARPFWSSFASPFPCPPPYPPLAPCFAAAPVVVVGVALCPPRRLLGPVAPSRCRRYLLICPLIVIVPVLLFLRLRRIGARPLRARRSPIRWRSFLPMALPVTSSCSTTRLVARVASRWRAPASPRAFDDRLIDCSVLFARGSAGSASSKPASPASASSPLSSPSSSSSLSMSPLPSPPRMNHAVSSSPA